MNPSRATLEAIATDLGRKAGVSGLESGDYDTYKEEFADEEEPPEACLAEDYWEAEYEGFMEEAIDALTPEQKGSLPNLDELRPVLRDLYGAAFAVAVKE
jgi:hypothetical protein